MDERLNQIMQAVTSALVDAGLKKSGYGWRDFNLRFGDSYSAVSVTISPEYYARKYGAQHATFRIKRTDDPAAKLPRIVEKAQACVKAEREGCERQERAREAVEAREARMRAAAAEHFPDFDRVLTGRGYIVVSREADGCEVRLTVSGDEVQVQEVKFQRYQMTIADARAIVGTLPAKAD